MAMDLSVLTEMVRSNMRLILPNVGAFFVQDLETGFRVENVTFSTFLRYDDGKLTELIAQKRGISTAEAAQEGSKICQFIASELHSNGTCAIPGLGLLKQHDNSQIEFVPDESLPSTQPFSSVAAAAATPPQTVPPQVNGTLNTSGATAGPNSQTPPPSSKGKETVQSRAQRQRSNKRPQTKRPAAQTAQPSHGQQQAKGQKTGKFGFAKFVLLLFILAAIAAAADFLWFGWVSPNYFPNTSPYLKVRTRSKLDAAANKVKMADAKSGENIAQSAQIDSAAEATAASGSSLAEDFKHRSEESGDAAPSSATPTGGAASPSKTPLSTPSASTYPSSGNEATSAERAYATPSEANSFHIIVGSFEDIDNAKRFSHELKNRGFASSIIRQESGGNAVTVGSFTSVRAARQACESMKNRFPDAWVLEY